MTDREKMYLDYKLEMCKKDGHDGLIDPVENYLADVKFFQRAKGVHWVRILSKDKKEIGFLIVLNKRRTEPKVDYRILEAYIKPEYRRQHIMSKAVRKFIRERPERNPVVRFSVLDNNLVAKWFWLNVYHYYPSDDFGNFVGPFPSKIEGSHDYGYNMPEWDEEKEDETDKDFIEDDDFLEDDVCEDIYDDDLLDDNFYDEELGIWKTT